MRAERWGQPDPHHAARCKAPQSWEVLELGPPHGGDPARQGVCGGTRGSLALTALEQDMEGPRQFLGMLPRGAQQPPAAPAPAKARS